MIMSDKTDIYIGSFTGAPESKQYFALKWANRHGLIAGATGTGKTVTLQVLAEGFAAAGVPVFMADVKGDLSGICQPSEMQDFLLKRAETIGMGTDFKPSAFSCAFWDVFGDKGTPVRTTVSEIGPILLAHMLELNDVQEGVLNIAFRIADRDGLLLLDLKDLRALLVSVSERAEEISSEFGNVSPTSIASIQRALLRLEDQGANKFLGETALDLKDFIRTDIDGRGYINILNAVQLMNSPRLYAVFLLWLLSELFEELPEAGDAAKPKLVFFFDEAHLLFTDSPKPLLDKIEQVVRLIRSKGVGIYFVTQNPQDIPESVLGQLGNRIQHGLRAYTPQQQRFIKVAAETYRENPAFNVADVITELSVGEALVSTLEDKGIPSVVQRVLIRPPSSRLGVASESAVMMARQAAGMDTKYAQTIDRESAYEILTKRAEVKMAEAAKQNQTVAPPAPAPKSSGNNRQGLAEAAIKSVVRAASSSLGRQIMNQLVRGILGGLRR
jgi:hypothetical protein